MIRTFAVAALLLSATTVTGLPRKPKVKEPTVLYFEGRKFETSDNLYGWEVHLKVDGKVVICGNPVVKRAFRVVVCSGIRSVEAQRDDWP